MCAEESGTVQLGVGVAVGREVTPTASQVSVIKFSAVVRSSPVQVDCMHDWTLSMNTGFSQRHLLSVEAQPPRGALAMQTSAHSRG